MSDLIPFGSVLLQDWVSTPEMRRIWTEREMVQSWMEVEKAITRAQAELDMIPADAAEEIVGKLTPSRLSVERIAEHKKTVRHLMVAFLKAFHDVCGPAAEHFHVGPTTQDILDTGLTLQMVSAHRLIMTQLGRLEDLLCNRALEHKDTIQMGRTHQQHAAPTTFGLVLATWATEISDHAQRAAESEKRWQMGCLSSAVGALNTFVELSDVETARRLQELFCHKLGLRVPLADLHSRTDRFAEVVTNLAELTSSLGEMGMNLASWQRTEVMEVEEPYDRDYVSSSTMPNKVNPESSEQVEGLAKLVRGLALAMQDMQMLDNRDATRLPVEYTAIPATYLMASRALSTMATNIAGMVVHKERMLANLSHPSALGQAVAERLMIAMYKKTGRKAEAHSLLHQLSADSRRNRVSFLDTVRGDESLAEMFTEEELEALFDLTTYTGRAALQAEEAVRAVRARRASQT